MDAYQWINGWMDGGLRHMQIISHSFMTKVIRLECISHVLAQCENEKHLVKPPWHRNPNRKTINQSKQVSAFHPIHIRSFISSIPFPAKLEEKVRRESHHDFTIFSRASNNISA